MLQEEPNDARVCCTRRREQGRRCKISRIETRRVKLAECQKRVDCIDVWRRLRRGEDPLNGVVECTP